MPYLRRTDIKLDTTFDELHAVACAFVEAEFGRHGKLDPPLYVVNDGTYWIWVNAPCASNDEKYMNVVAVRKILFETTALHYSHMSEAYHFTLDENGTRLGDDFAFCVTVDRDGTFLVTTWTVTEVANGPNFLGPRTDLQGDPLMTNIAGEMWALYGTNRSAAAGE